MSLAVTVPALLVFVVREWRSLKRVVYVRPVFPVPNNQSATELHLSKGLWKSGFCSPCWNILFYLPAWWILTGPSIPSLNVPSTVKSVFSGSYRPWTFLRPSTQQLHYHSSFTIGLPCKEGSPSGEESRSNFPAPSKGLDTEKPSMNICWMNEIIKLTDTQSWLQKEVILGFVSTGPLYKLVQWVKWRSPPTLPKWVRTHHGGVARGGGVKAAQCPVERLNAVYYRHNCYGRYHCDQGSLHARGGIWGGLHFKNENIEIIHQPLGIQRWTIRSFFLRNSVCVCVCGVYTCVLHTLRENAIK